MDLRVVATLKAKAGKEKDLETLMKSVAKDTHREQGCLFYSMHRTQSDPGIFIFVEKWTGPDALQDHLSSPHVAAALARKDELLESIEIVPLIPIPAGDSKKEVF